ncbi:MAG: capsular polysaccharide synthesis protein [Alphaproteobacteria bacterium]|nr:capsular polysaccharide synthesis protein [Alphaproteobacteria bacterium]
MYLPTKIKKQLVRFAYNFSFAKDKKFKRKKALAMLDKKYLRRYLYALDNLPKEIKPEPKEDIIWTCWLQGEENAPPIVKACINSIRRTYPQKKLIIITSENIRQYADIPTYIYDKWHKGIITNTHFSDILRVCLLYQHGGTWMDATVFLGDIVDENIMHAPFFAFHSRTYLRTFPKILDSNSWFLHSVPQHPLMTGMRALLFAFWQNENQLIHYFLYHLFFDLMVENNAFCRNLWQQTPLFYDDEKVEALYLNLLNKFSLSQYQEIIHQSPIQKLSYKYEKPQTDFITFEQYILNKQ